MAGGKEKYIDESSSCRNILLNELNARKEKNSMYSLRAFSRDLKIGSTSLSDVLSGKRLLSKRNLEKVSERLSLSPLEIATLLEERKGNYPLKNAVEIERLQLEEDTFRLIADWHYFAILNLAKIANIPYDQTVVATRLNLTQKQAEIAIDRLCRLKLISNENGFLRRTSRPVTTSNDVPSRGLKKHHKDILEKAMSSLEAIDLNKREISSMTLAIDPAKLPEAKKIIRKTILKLEKMLEVDCPLEVYAISFQLFPLSQLRPVQ